MLNDGTKIIFNVNAMRDKKTTSFLTRCTRKRLMNLKKKKEIT